MKYKNKNKYCTYPYTGNTIVDACWSYISYVNKNLIVAGKKINTAEKLEKHCRTCEFYKEGLLAV